VGRERGRGRHHLPDGARAAAVALLPFAAELNLEPHLEPHFRAELTLEARAQVSRAQHPCPRPRYSVLHSSHSGASPGARAASHLEARP
jgi:hypothetical protein